MSAYFTLGKISTMNSQTRSSQRTLSISAASLADRPNNWRRQMIAVLLFLQREDSKAGVQFYFNCPGGEVRSCFPDRRKLPAPTQTGRHLPGSRAARSEQPIPTDGPDLSQESH